MATPLAYGRDSDRPGGSVVRAVILAAIMPGVGTHRKWATSAWAKQGINDHASLNSKRGKRATVPWVTNVLIRDPTGAIRLVLGHPD